MNRRNFVHLVGLSTLSMCRNQMSARTAEHVIVAGGGIIGASIAYHLAKRGARVTLLEKEHPAAGTTKNSFAWLNASAKNPRAYYALNLAGMNGWRRLELEIGPALTLQWGGGLQWCGNDAKAVDAMKKHVRERQAWGYGVRLIDQEELKHLIPYVEPGELGAANFADQEGTVDPVAAAKALITKGQSYGVKVVYPCELTEIKSSNGRVSGVVTTQGAIEADGVVLATGNATMAIAQKAGMNVPLKESKGVLAHCKPGARLVDRVLMPPGCNIKQNTDGRVVTGPSFEDTGDTAPSMETGQQYLAKAASFVPQLKADLIDYMTLGYRVMPKDGLPIVGRSAGLPNLYVAAMHSGMTLAPVIGELAALEILDQADVDLLAPFRPARFA